jgi:exosortase/archaeosortase family protein
MGKGTKVTNKIRALRFSHGEMTHGGMAGLLRRMFAGLPRMARAAMLGRGKTRVGYAWFVASHTTLAAIAAILEAGTVKPVIDGSYPLNDAPLTVAHMLGHHARGNVAMTMWRRRSCLSRPHPRPHDRRRPIPDLRSTYRAARLYDRGASTRLARVAFVMGAAKLAVEVFLQSLSLLLLLWGCRGAESPRSRALRVSGWCAFALFCCLDAALLLAASAAEGVGTRAVLGAGALLMVHRESTAAHGLRSRLYIARVASATGLANLAVSHLTFLEIAVTYFVAAQSILLPVLMGMGVTLPRVETMGQSLLLKTLYAPVGAAEVFPKVRIPVHPTNIAIVYGCTGVREMILVLFLVAFTGAPSEKKRKAVLIGTSAVYLGNLARNNLVVLLHGGGKTSFELAHGLIGHLLVMLVLIAAAVVVFFVVPEIPDHLAALIGHAPARNTDSRTAAGR